MSNVDVIRASYAASADGNPAGILADLAPDAEWIEMDGFPCAGTYRGPDEVIRGVFERLGSEWEDYQAIPDAYVDGGATVVVTGHYSGVYRGTGKPMRVRFAHVWQLDGGRITGFEQFTDTLRVDEAMRT